MRASRRPGPRPDGVTASRRLPIAVPPSRLPDWLTMDTTSRRPIALLPLGPLSPGLADRLAASLATLVAAPVVILSGVAPPESGAGAAADRRRAQDLLAWIGALPRAGCLRTLAVIAVDLELDPPAPGTAVSHPFGIADPLRGTAVVSTCRLAVAEDADPGTNSGSNAERLARRVLTESVHELGHTFGLGHCSNRACVMFPSASSADTEAKGPRPCARCARAFPTADPTAGPSARCGA